MKFDVECLQILPHNASKFLKNRCSVSPTPGLLIFIEEMLLLTAVLSYLHTAGRVHNILLDDGEFRENQRSEAIINLIN
jgi:hypothetical protein